MMGLKVLRTVVMMLGCLVSSPTFAIYKPDVPAPPKVVNITTESTQVFLCPNPKDDAELQVVCSADARVSFAISMTNDTSASLKKDKDNGTTTSFNVRLTKAGYYNFTCVYWWPRDPSIDLLYIDRSDVLTIQVTESHFKCKEPEEAEEGLFPGLAIIIGFFLLFVTCVVSIVYKAKKENRDPFDKKNQNDKKNQKTNNSNNKKDKNSIYYVNFGYIDKSPESWTKAVSVFEKL